ncbi:MAG: NUDIX domain-containing protein [bacterium]|nr:NUDIX domain-containing protein [bacterium]
MPHIHTKPGEIDFVSDVYIVHKNKVLIRLHEKYKIWIAPGGHIELNETPEETAVREVEEETGLEIELYSGNKTIAEKGSGRLRQLVPPMFMNIHNVNEKHRHIVFVYFATAKSDLVIQPDTNEKTDCRWFTKEGIIAAPEIEDTIKSYALKALELLGRES